MWSIRVDVTVLDDGGNIIDCASIATITALSHFRCVDIMHNSNNVITKLAEILMVDLRLIRWLIHYEVAFFSTSLSRTSVTSNCCKSNALVKTHYFS